MWGCYILCPPPRTGDAAWAAPDRHAAPRHAPWGHEHRGLVLLARRQEHHHGLAPVLATKVHLGRCPASTPTERFRCRVPFFPPPHAGGPGSRGMECRGAIDMMLGPVYLPLGIHGLLEGEKDLIPDAPLLPVPEPAIHRAPGTVALLGKVPPGGAGADHAAWNAVRMPFRMVRSSLRGRPFLAWGGRCGAICFHCVSVLSLLLMYTTYHK